MAHFAVMVVAKDEDELSSRLSTYDVGNVYEHSDPNEWGELWYCDNPKWDYWEVGGRYSNLLLLKDASKSNTALISEIDFEEMRKSNARQVTLRWQRVEKILGGLDVDISEFRGMSRPSVALLYEQLDDIGDKMCLLDFYLDSDAKETIEEEAIAYYDSRITFALLDDKGWIDEDTNLVNLDELYWERIGDLQPTDRIYTVDCHV
jgi:hypothetical protein